MTSLSAALPEPKYRDDDKHTSLQDPAQLVDTQVLVKATGAPPYGRRSGWIPRTLDDYGDGGAFPEINIAQYPLEMARKKSVCLQVKVQWTNGNQTTSNALQLQVDGKGNIQYDAIVRQGHEDIANSQIAAAQPKNVRRAARNEPTYIRYTPVN